MSDIRLIDANELQQEYIKENGKRLLLIDVAPTVDTKRPQGKWEYEEIMIKKYYARCPFCNFSFEMDMHRELPYFCGACGADMREKEN